MKRTSADIASDLRRCVAISQMAISRLGSKPGSWVEETLGFALKDCMDLVDELDALLARDAAEVKTESDLNALRQSMINREMSQAQPAQTKDAIGWWVRKIPPTPIATEDQS